MDIPPLRIELSAETKQSFQVVAFFATVFVVAIHYGSAYPVSASIGDASTNELLQAFLTGGVARVAVPLFAFAAGFFYFLSDQGTLSCYLRKLRQRSRTLLIPYLIISAIGILAWWFVRQAEGNPVPLSSGELFAKWILNPQSVQLWFLRDLFVLVAVAPLLRLLLEKTYQSFLIGLAVLWMIHFQPFPVIGELYLLNIETLFFFCLGAIATKYVDWLVQLGNFRRSLTACIVLLWFSLILVRLILKPDYDSWYVQQYTITSLLIQKASILCGMVAMWAISWHLRSPLLSRLSGLAFFVYLVHEFPLQTALYRIADRVIEVPMRFWILFPITVIGCFTAGWLLERVLPTAFAIFTGGRSSQQAVSLSQADTPGKGMSR
ncbi:Acyltransferase family protein [Novipirellula aureliae]|uniref:Acyltransferase family protein n=1 Tax=Novipirellula aureliae TaxID=2527966 RepID=A0A5C6E572_9BACT|nr:acyltransferase [Novipirellula aureliae]TWU44092.1 Acyltransferase family protein [Novipirellula aureliae]